VKIIHPPARLHSLIGAIGLGLKDETEGELGAVIVADDRVTSTPRFVVCDAFAAPYPRIDAFCTELFDALAALADTRQINGAAPWPIAYCDEAMIEQLGRHIRAPWLGAATGGAPDTRGTVDIGPFSDWIEPDPRRRARTVAISLATGLVWFAPYAARKCQRHPFDALTRVTFGPYATALSDALGLAVAQLRGRPPAKRAQRARRDPHSSSAGQSAAR
jgi:hypothetical protein